AAETIRRQKLIPTMIERIRELFELDRARTTTLPGMQGEPHGDRHSRRRAALPRLSGVYNARSRAYCLYPPAALNRSKGPQSGRFSWTGMPRCDAARSYLRGAIRPKSAA